MRKLLSKVSTVSRIGYCILIIYIPILRYGNCKKVATNGILHCLLPGRTNKKKGRIPFLIKVFFQTTYWHVRNGKREVVIFCTPKFLECINQFSKEKY